METNMEQVQSAPVQVKKRNTKRWLLLLLVLLLAAGGGVLIWKQLTPKPQSQFELDANALAGFLPGKTEEEIQAELNRIIEKGFFNVSINPTPVVSAEGTVNLNIENVPANHYWMQVNVYLVDQKGAQTLLYQSGVIKPGYHIEEVTVAGELPVAGEYNGRADFTALLPDTQEDIGQTSATMLITVQGEA